MVPFCELWMRLLVRPATQFSLVTGCLSLFLEQLVQRIIYS